MHEKTLINSQEKILASPRYFVCQIWSYKQLVMSLGILNDLRPELKIVEFLVAQNINFIAYLEGAFNSDWKTCITF